jgi:hypothetical protein
MVNPISVRTVWIAMKGARERKWSESQENTNILKAYTMKK